MSTQPVDGAPAARRTRQGGALDAVLRAADGFRTAQDLHAELRHRGQPVGLTTVYRHLKMLVEAGTVDVVHGPDGEAQYRLCSGGERSRSDHHHHLVCRVCGSAVEVDGPDVEAWTESVAAANGYTDVSHTLEIFGRCPAHAR